MELFKSIINTILEAVKTLIRDFYLSVNPCEKRNQWLFLVESTFKSLRPTLGIYFAYLRDQLETLWRSTLKKKKRGNQYTQFLSNRSLHHSRMRSALPPLVKPIVTKKVPFKRPWPYRTRLNWYKLPFRVWSLVLSSGCLPKFPSVLLIASSAGVKKLGRSLMAHLYRSVSDCRVSWTRCTFWGVTQLWTRSSVTGVELLLVRAGCSGSVGGTTGLTGNSSCILLKASSSIVKRPESFSQFDVPSAVK